MKLPSCVGRPRQKGAQHDKVVESESVKSCRKKIVTELTFKTKATFGESQQNKNKLAAHRAQISISSRWRTRQRTPETSGRTAFAAAQVRGILGTISFNASKALYALSIRIHSKHVVNIRTLRFLIRQYRFQSIPMTLSQLLWNSWLIGSLLHAVTSSQVAANSSHSLYTRESLFAQLTRGWSWGKKQTKRPWCWKPYQNSACVQSQSSENEKTVPKRNGFSVEYQWASGASCPFVWRKP